MSRSVSTITRLRPEQRSAGFREATLFAGGSAELDPFLAFTDFHMSEPTFAPHPHAGFSAVTYMFRDSAGSFINRDSNGDHSVIAPGDLHWTQAARGMMHEEVPVRRGTDCHGLQMFVNLAEVDKQADPVAFHVDAADVPITTPAPGVTMRVVVGTVEGASSPLSGDTGLLTAITLLDVDLGEGARLSLPVAGSDRAVMMLMSGTVTVADDRLDAGDIATLDPAVGNLDLVGVADASTALVLWGTPIGEPVVVGGPFAMTTRDAVDVAQRRFRRGEMGALTPSF